jgi:nucleoside-diphosphate kinase
MERTLIILKPDALQRGLVGDILTRFEKAGLKIVGAKMVWPNEEHYRYHYEDISKIISRRGEDVYRRNTDFMLSGPVVAAVLEGVEAVTQVRKMVGDTEPKSANPGTIRGDYAHVSYTHVNERSKVGMPNLIHASGDEKEAAEEIAHWFKNDELFEYKLAHEHLTLQSDKLE